MKLAEILNDEALRQHEFPVTRDRIFLGHAAVSPLPRRVTEAMRGYLERAEVQDQETALPPGWMRELRGVAARLMDARPEEIALVGPTSLALSFVASGIPLKRHSNILIYHDDYPSNVYPWMALAEQGVEVRFLQVASLGRIRPVDVKSQVDENTRLVALASCHYVSGYRLDVDGIGEYLRKRGIAFCVDGIQTLGAFPTPVTHVDFMAADAHKWMLGPCAAGLLYVRKEWQDYLQPPIFGWHNVRCRNFLAADHIEFRSDAGRYEAGTANLAGLVGLRAALELLLEIGVEEIARELGRKRQWLVPVLQEKGYTVLHAGEAAERVGGMITFYREGPGRGAMAALHGKLLEAGVTASVRSDREGREYLRLSPHFYNTDAELQRVLEML